MTILGQPMPSLFGKLLHKLENDPDNEENVLLVENYTIKAAAKKKDTRL
jgi:hypothetical protein